MHQDYGDLNYQSRQSGFELDFLVSTTIPNRLNLVHRFLRSRDFIQVKPTQLIFGCLMMFINLIIVMLKLLHEQILVKRLTFVNHRGLSIVIASISTLWIVVLICPYYAPRNKQFQILHIQLFFLFLKFNFSFRLLGFK